MARPAGTRPAGSPEAGDLDGSGLLADHVRAVAPHTDAIVLAQASMQLLQPLVAGLGIPVLSSPRIGVVAAAQLAADVRRCR